MRHIAILAGLAGTIGTAAPAFAADATATLEIVGQISPKCSINLQDNNISETLTDHPGSESVALSVDCNQRLVVNMHSLNGGFLHESGKKSSGSPDFISLLPYTATFQVDASGASPVSFRSEEMAAGGGANGSIGVAPYKAKGALKLSWAPEKPLIGGAYNDVIEIRVSGAGETSSSAT
jgi:hypothetical protein